MILYHRYFSFKLSYLITGPCPQQSLCPGGYTSPRILNLMDEGGERMLNLKIATTQAEIQGQMSFKLQYPYVKIAKYENSNIYRGSMKKIRNTHCCCMKIYIIC